MSEVEASRHAEAVAQGMGITIYVVRTREGDFLPVQQPPDGCEIIAEITPPDGVHESPLFDRE